VPLLDPVLEGSVVLPRATRRMSKVGKILAIVLGKTTKVAT